MVFDQGLRVECPERAKRVEGPLRTISAAPLDSPSFGGLLVAFGRFPHGRLLSVPKQILRIGLVQMHCEKGRVETNLAAMAAYIEEAAARGVDIVCFPEMSITGYVDPSRDLVLDRTAPPIARFVAFTKSFPVTAIAGFAEANPGGKPFITQVAARDGKALGFYRKNTIHADEKDLFAPGTGVPIFVHPKAKTAVAVCADIDNPGVFAEAAGKGAHFVFLAAAPGLYGARETRDWRAGYDWWRSECHTKLSKYARENGIYIAAATQTGRTRDEDFPGGGYVFGPDGGCLAETKDWSEGMLYADIPLADSSGKR